ncbi:MAG: DUF192 domain-containing protein [Azovibrio sp.]
MKTKSILAPFLIIALLLTSLSLKAEGSPIEMFIGFHRIEAEVASTQEERMQGLMQRTRMGTNKGMLFVFPTAQRHCMWMKNTLIPLAVAFIDDNGTIINIREMPPQTENNHCADAPARFALEMNQGWFSTRGIEPGTTLIGIRKAPRPQ